MSQNSQFDRSRLVVKPLGERIHDLSHAHLLALDASPAPLSDAAMRDLTTLGQRLVAARGEVPRSWF